LFGYENRLDIDLVDDFWHEDEMVTPKHNNMLHTDFTEHGMMSGKLSLALMLKEPLALIVFLFILSTLLGFDQR
jgi:hypothetical protein